MRKDAQEVSQWHFLRVFAQEPDSDCDSDSPCEYLKISGFVVFAFLAVAALVLSFRYYTEETIVGTGLVLAIAVIVAAGYNIAQYKEPEDALVEQMLMEEFKARKQHENLKAQVENVKNNSLRNLFRSAIEHLEFGVAQGPYDDGFQFTRRKLYF